MPLHDRHLDDGTLRAYLDRELAPSAALRAAWHVWRCARCRRALNDHRALRARSRELLSVIPHSVDVEAAWRQLSSLRAGRRRPRPSIVRAWSFAVALLVLVAAVGAVRFAGWRGLGSASTRPVGQYARDVCCFDLDAGGPGDDGVFTLSGTGQRVDCVLVYDDIDRSRALSAGDRMRYVSRKSGCERAITAQLATGAGGTTVASLAPAASVPHSSMLSERWAPE